MQIILLILVIVFSSLQQIIQKRYNLKEKNTNALLFSALTSFTAMIFFVLSSGFKLNFSLGILPYSIGFAAAYSSACVGLVLALKFGPLAISSLIISYSLIIPAMYGVIFLKDSLSLYGYVGIGLLLVSLLLLNLKKEEGKFSMKWLLFVIVAFVGNGMCSTVQKMQQLRFDGDFKNEFMITALIISGAVMLIIAYCQGGRINVGALKYAIPNGVSNGIVNLLVMILTGMIPNAVLFPSISAGGIVLSCITAIFIFKEKLSRMQIVGYIMGIISVIFLNI